MNDKTERRKHVCWEKLSLGSSCLRWEVLLLRERWSSSVIRVKTWVFAQGWGLSRVMSLCIGLKYRPCRSEDLVQFWSCVWSGWRMGCASVWQSDRLYPCKSDYNYYYSCICHFIQNQWRWFMSMSTGSAWTSLTKRRRLGVPWLPERQQFC